MAKSCAAGAGLEQALPAFNWTMPVGLAERRPRIQVLVEGSAAISPGSTVLSRGPSHAAAGDPPAALDLPGLQGAALAAAQGPAGKAERAESPAVTKVVQPQRSTSPSRQGQGWSHRLQGHTPQQELPALFGLWPQQQVTHIVQAPSLSEHASRLIMLLLKLLLCGPCASEQGAFCGQQLPKA